jgi:phosphoribosylamine--glycine ligase
LGNSVAQARDRAYQAAELITWPGKYNRTDIGMKAINRPGGGMK